MSDGWFLGQNHTGPDLLEKVGAATNFTLGGKSQRYLFINEAGNEIKEWFSFASEDDRFEGARMIHQAFGSLKRKSPANDSYQICRAFLIKNQPKHMNLL